MADNTKPPWVPWEVFLWKTHLRWFPRFTSTLEPDAEIHTPQVLQDAKNRIEACSSQHIWEFSKKMSNPYELVYTYKSPYIPQSLSVMKPLSRSYFKMVEILQLTGFLQGRRGTIRTAHVCEGPGGFMEAIYEEAAKRQQTVKRTHAMTLRSTKPHIPGWRRAQQFMSRYKNQITIEYGADNTGNILHAPNRAAFLEAVRKDTTVANPVHIFTADGGFDFTGNYLAQETNIFQLLLASITIGFQCLAKDGLFVLKLFDCFSTATMQLTSYMASCFEKWTLYKPASSRPCNSEQYFIGTQFRGVRAEEIAALEKMITFMGIPKYITEDPIPASIMNALVKQRDMHLQRQITLLNVALDRAFEWSERQPTEKELYDIWTETNESSKQFCNKFGIIMKYPLPPISCHFALPPADSDGTHGEDTSQPDVCQQS